MQIGLGDREWSVIAIDAIMLDLEGARGATVDRDDILLDPLKILPPPAIEGRLAWIGVEGDELVQRFVHTALDTVFAIRDGECTAQDLDCNDESLNGDFGTCGTSFSSSGDRE